MGTRITMVFTFFFFLQFYLFIFPCFFCILWWLNYCWIVKKQTKKKRLDNQINADRLIPEIPNFHFSLWGHRVGLFNNFIVNFTLWRANWNVLSGMTRIINQIYPTVVIEMNRTCMQTSQCAKAMLTVNYAFLTLSLVSHAHPIGKFFRGVVVTL